MPAPRSSRGDGGQVLPLLAVLLALALGLTVVVGRTAVLAADRARAQSAADAAALAGVAGGRPASERVARAAGAELERWSRRGLVVDVVVRWGRATAAARAEGVVDALAAPPGARAGPPSRRLACCVRRSAAPGR